MNSNLITIKNKELPVHETNTLVIGSGAASLNSAVHLKEFGVEDVTIATSNLGDGTSANAGSDKQTYYKLSLAGENPDSPLDMARTYYEGGATHGDLALIESALSAREFFHLVNLGVDFPFNEFGEYVGYRTDNDPKGRGTSAGPWTSQQMVEKLLQEVRRMNIEIMDEIEIIALLTGKQNGEKRIYGALGLDKTEIHRENLGLVVFGSENVVFGVGGPGGLYQDSVYPRSQVGSIGLALERGAVASNLTEGQFGLASTDFRWNLSGSYQQVIPRYYSVDQSGQKIDFLNEAFSSMEELSEAIFLKGYQWPFDPERVQNYGSSLIDLLVYREEKIRGRQVFLDYQKNPQGGDGLENFDVSDLRDQPKEYLGNSDALEETPVERLKELNPKALELYRQNGIDLTEEPLKVAVCAQHNNGGLRGNKWWESNIKHLFPVGEVNGSHGVSRPGGSALNAGQVGGLRAAQYISETYDEGTRDVGKLLRKTGGQIEEKVSLAVKFLNNCPEGTEDNCIEPGEAISLIKRRMSQYGSLVREREGLKDALSKARKFQNTMDERLKPESRSELPLAFRARRLALTSLFYLRAIHWYLENEGGSRGSYLIRDKEGGMELSALNDHWYFRGENEELKDRVQQTYLDESGRIVNEWVKRREIPDSPRWFENVWENYRNGEVYT